MIKRIIKYLRKRKILKKWKEEKRKKWLAEGMNKEEVEKKLTEHKIEF